MHNNGIITAPVNTDDVSAVLGENSHDVATLCSSSKINPAAKYKPVRYDKPSSLSVANDEWMGSASEIADGYYYGLKIRASKSFVELHSCNYSYRQVRPGTDWSRLDDFVGYKHNAILSPYGIIDNIVLYDATNGGEIGVQLYFRTTKSDSEIDLESLLSKISSASDAFKNMYPCALVTRQTKNSSGAYTVAGYYVRALWCADVTLANSNAGYYKICQNNAYRNKWLINLKSLPGLQAGDRLLVTIFLKANIYGSANNNLDFRSWLSVNTTLRSSENCYTVYQLVSKFVNIQPRYRKAVSTIGVMLTSNNARVIISWFTTDADKPELGKQYTVHFSLHPVGSEFGTGIIDKSVAFTAPTSESNLALGGAANVTTGVLSGSQDVEYSGTWYVEDAGGNLCNSGSLAATLPKT